MEIFFNTLKIHIIKYVSKRRDTNVVSLSRARANANAMPCEAIADRSYGQSDDYSIKPSFSSEISAAVSSHVEEHVSLTGYGFDLVVVDVSNVIVVELAPAVVAGEISGDGGVMTGVGGLTVVCDARGEVVGEGGRRFARFSGGCFFLFASLLLVRRGGFAFVATFFRFVECRLFNDDNFVVVVVVVLLLLGRRFQEWFQT